MNEIDETIHSIITDISFKIAINHAPYKDFKTEIYKQYFYSIHISHMNRIYSIYTGHAVSVIYWIIQIIKKI